MTCLRTSLIAGQAPDLSEALRACFQQAGNCVVGVSRSAALSWLLDLTNTASAHGLFAAIDRECPPLAGVIHNAMRFHRQALLQTSLEALESVWRSMVLTVFNTAKAALPGLVQANGGTLSFSGASVSLGAGPGFATFSSAKFILRGLTKAFAREHSPQGIHLAHAVSDGLIEPKAFAQQCLRIFHQPPLVWTEALNICPSGPAR